MMERREGEEVRRGGKERGSEGREREEGMEWRRKRHKEGEN